jgi:SIR2-like domain
MIPHILLTGAGFSHNWGGYLAKEAFDYLLGVTEHDEDLRRVLWADQAKGWGFETTLARLRKEYEENYSPQVEQDFNNMTTAVRRMFGDMWLAFSQSTFDNRFDDKRLGVIRFLTRFDAIFTLNQDTLLETHYLPVVTSTDFAKNTYQGPRNIGAYRPGLVQASDTLTFGSLASQIPLYKAGEDFTAVPNLQPYFKLHGSIDIQDGRNMMLILGGDKEADIAKHPLLESYHAQFRLWLSMPRARLMVVGYSFADAHINKMIFDAIENGLKLFLIGPDGATTIGANRSFPLNPGPTIRNAIVGASSRPIRNTLSGNDMVELMKIERFFQDGRMAISYLKPAL